MFYCCSTDVHHEEGEEEEEGDGMMAPDMPRLNWLLNVTLALHIHCDLCNTVQPAVSVRCALVCTKSLQQINALLPVILLV